MTLLHIDQLPHDNKPKKRTIHNLFRSPRTVDERLPDLVRDFVFYTPVVHYLVGDPARTALATDVVSHTLALEMGEHPLILTDLTRPVFRWDERLIVRPDLKSFQNTLYAATQEVWNDTVAKLRMVTLCDQAAHRFCVLVPHVLEIASPIGARDELAVPVHYFQCYGNREILYFQDESEGPHTPRPIPSLRDHPPVREFMLMADRVLRAMSGPVSDEQRIERTIATMDGEEALIGLYALRDPKIPDTEISTPLQEAKLHDRYLRECHDIIRFYESVFGPTGGI